MGRSQFVILRDLVIFQVKLMLDGVKDIVLMPLSIAAAVLDLIFPGSRPGHRFYGVMRVGERYDRWLSLFSAADNATSSTDGLFGHGREDPESMLARIENMLEHEETPRRSARPVR